MLQPIVLSGGSGSRLWPLSREQQPKQLLKLFGEFSMLQSTILRLADFSGDLPISRKPIVVCNQSYRFVTAEQLQEIKVTGTVMLEPFARNIAPALTVAALQTIAAGHPDALMLVMPADHLIDDQAAFHAAVSIGIKCATEGALVCFGVVPNKPDVGYGYIKMNRAESTNGANPLISIVEKPNAKTAQEFLDTGDDVWNSGIFLMKAHVWLDAIEKLNPKMHKACSASVAKSKTDSDFLRINESEFEAEHWIVVKGTGKTTKGDETFLLSDNQSAYIPIGMVHRFENPGKFPLKMIEVQSGSYLGEDDIVRFEDVYGRVETAALA